jgi:hypothetical protein
MPTFVGRPALMELQRRIGAHPVALTQNTEASWHEAVIEGEAVVEARMLAPVESDPQFDKQRAHLTAARFSKAGTGLIETPISALLRTSLLRCTRDLHSVQDQIDCAELLFAGDLRDSARTLYNVTFLRLGFGASGVTRQAEIASRTRLWEDDEWMRSPIAPVSQLGHAFAIAIDELKEILNSTTDIAIVSVRKTEAGEPISGRPGAVTMDPSAFAAMANGVGDLCEQLCAVLRHPVTDRSREDLDRLLARVQHEVLSQPSLDFRSYVGEIPLMAACLAFNSFRSFFLSNYDLAYPPFGSTELFDMMARLDGVGLGTYATNMTQLIGNCRDIFGMIQLAAGTKSDGTVERDLLETWSVRLSQHVDGSLLHGLIEELADLGLMAAIWGIYGRIVRQSDVFPDMGILWCIRDAGLDNGDVSLALAAQKEVLRWSPDSTIEWIVLGEMEATYGQMEEAKASFMRALRIEPAHKGAKERIEALRTGRFERFTINGGFGSSNTRKLLRSARQRQAPGDWDEVSTATSSVPVDGEAGPR